MELDHELRAQGLEETPSTLWIVPRSRAQAVESAITLASGEYQSLVKSCVSAVLNMLVFMLESCLLCFPTENEVITSKNWYVHFMYLKIAYPVLPLSLVHFTVKKHHCDTDDSHDIVVSSTFTSTKSIAFFEVSYYFPQYNERCVVTYF